MLRRPELPLLALLLGAYAYFYQAGGWNQNSRFDLTRAIVERGVISIDRLHANTGDESFRNGHHFCDKAPGASLLAVPPYAVAHALGVTRPDTGAYVATVFSTAIPAALGVLAVYILAATLGATRRRAALVALGCGLGTLMFPYATLFYGHATMAGLFVLAFALLARARRAPASFWTLFGVGALLGGAVVVEYPAALGVVVLGAYAATFVGWRGLAAIALGGLGPAILLGAYHAAAFGGPLVLPYAFSTQHHRHEGWFMGIGAPDWDALAGITYSRYRGLFYGAPWLLLALAGAGRLLAARATRREAIVCLVVFVLFLWLNASLVDWEGGWACGPRYLVPAIPFLAAAAAGWPRGRIATAALAAAIALSAALMLVATAVKPEVYVKILAPFQDYLVPRFWRGLLAVSTQSIDALGPPPGAPAYAWNLGQLLGLPGLWSLAPLAVWVAGWGVQLFRSTREL